MEANLYSRQDRAAIVAQAAAADLQALWKQFGADPAFSYLRGPQTGLVALRGRVGGGGAPFPFADATATRASIRLETGAVGHAVTLGRDRQRATIAAVIDALCKDPQQASRIDRELIEPLQRSTEARDLKRAEQTAATRVDFFTLVRGED